MSVRNAERKSIKVTVDEGMLDKLIDKISVVDVFVPKYYKHKSQSCYIKMSEKHGDTATVLTIYDYSYSSMYMVSTTDYFDLESLDEYSPITEDEFIKVRNKVFHHIVDAM